MNKKYLYATAVCAARALSFVAAFAIDVHAKAAVDLPDGCMRSSAAELPCAISTVSNEHLRLVVPGGIIVLDEASVVARSAVGIVLVKGAVLVQSGEGREIAVVNEYGTFVVRDAQALAWRERERAWIGVLSGDVAIRGKGIAPLGLDPGMQNWMGPVTRGHASVGYPTALEFVKRLAQFARLFPGDREAFALQAGQLAQSWKTSVRTIASLDESRARDRIASIRADEQRKAAALARKDADDRELRALFRKKSLDF